MVKSNGHAVDAEGNPVADPTSNVNALVIAEGRRQDDLRMAEGRRQDDLRIAAKELNDERDRHRAELSSLRDAHTKELSLKESGRVDSLRQGDREETTRATVAAQANIATLATTTTQLADTLRTQVANTAGIAETRQSSYAGEVNKHFAEIDRALSEGKGKQGVADPANERLALAVDRLVAGGDRHAGQGEGLSTSAKILMAVVSIVAAGVAVVGGLIGIGATIYAVLKP